MCAAGRFAVEGGGFIEQDIQIDAYVDEINQSVLAVAVVADNQDKYKASQYIDSRLVSVLVPPSCTSVIMTNQKSDGEKGSSDSRPQPTRQNTIQPNNF